MQHSPQNEQFENIWRSYRGIFLKIAKLYCPDEDDRQDLLQEMKIQVWQSLPRYDPNHKLSTWLYRVVLNVAISYYRKQSRRPVIESLNDTHSQQLPATNNDPHEVQLSLLEHFLSELQELDKALMVLYLEQKSHAEIADILGISTSNVSTKILRIKDKLKQRFLNP